MNKFTARPGLLFSFAALLFAPFSGTLAVAQTNVGVIRNAPALKAGQSLGDIDFDTTPGTTTINLTTKLEYPSGGGDYVRIETPFGNIYLEFLNADAPETVANFKSYLATDATSAAEKLDTYDGTFVHRVVRGFVLQTGGYHAVSLDDIPPITSKGEVDNEFKVANTRGTVAMAKVDGDPDSATCEWFINLADNRANLDNQNGGFTAFARVLGDGMGVADSIAALNQLNLGGAFENLPYYNVQPGQTDLALFNFFPLTKVRSVSADSVPAALKTPPAITISLVGAGVPQVAKVSLAQNVLKIVPGAIGGRVPVTVRASIGNGIYSDFTFYVGRQRVPAILSQLPGVSTKAFGAVASFVASTSVWPAGTIRWERKISGGEWTTILADDPLFTGENGAELKIALDSTVSPAAVLAALQGNQFRFVLVNALGTTISKPTTLKITTLPVGFSAQPPKLATGQLGGNATISVTSLPAAANTPVSYQWMRLPAGQNPKVATNWIPLANSTAEVPTRYTGATTRTLTISLAGADDTAKFAALALNDDQYRCVITNALGAATSTASRLRVLTEDFTAVTQEDLPLPGLSKADGRRFSAVGVPKGLALDEETGCISGTPTAKPGIYKVTVTIREAGMITGTRVHYIEVRALSSTQAARFEALLSPETEDAPPVAKLSLVVAANGTFTGTLVTAKDKPALPLKGAFMRDPSTGALSLAAPLSITRPGLAAGHIYLLPSLGITTGGVLSATLTRRDGSAASPVPEGANAAGVRLATYSAANPAPWTNVAAYNLGLTKPSLLAPGGSASPIPAGSGYARAPIDAAGTLKVTGKLPDGAPFTASVPTTANASYRLFARPYGATTGTFFSSDFKLASAVAYNPAQNRYFSRYALAAGAGLDTYWTRPAGVAKPSGYASGFGPLGLTLAVQPWFFFNGTNLGISFTENDTLATIDVVFNGAILPAAGLPATLKLDFAKLTFTDATPPDALKLSIKLTEATGNLTGSLFLPDGRKVVLEGVVLVPANPNNTSLAAGTVTAEGLAIIPAAAGSSAGPTTERFRLHQSGAIPAP